MKFLRNNKVEAVLLIALVIVAAFPALRGYLNFSVVFDLLWILLLPFILYVRKAGEFSNRYFYVAVASVAGFVVIPSAIFLFLAVCFLVFFIIERKIGMLNRLAPVFIVLITPLTKYFLDIFGFPVRLQLSKAASYLLSLVGYQSEAQGNIIMLNGAEFSVDPSCMGLKMVITSLLITLLFISMFERKFKRTLPVLPLILIFGTAFKLIVADNLVRIILLVILGYPAETLGHELVGIGTLVLIVLLPMYYTVKTLVRKTGKPWNDLNTRTFAAPRSVQLLLTPAVITVIALFSWTQSAVPDIPHDPIAETITIPGYRKEVLANNVIRFTNGTSTIYIKPCKGVFRSDHHPLICWRGSGYEFSRERVIEFNGTSIYTAQLVSNENTLQTAWWYDNGKEKTIDQLHWRWKMIRGASPYRLVNITGSDWDGLMREVNVVWNEE